MTNIILNEIAKKYDFYINFVHKLQKRDREEANSYLNDYILVVVEDNNLKDKLIKAYKGDYFYLLFTAMLKNEILFYNSKTNRKNKIRDNVEDALFYLEYNDTECFIKKEQMLDDILNDDKDTTLSWYERNIMKLYYFQRMNMKQISNKTTIPLTSIFYAIQTATQKLKKKISHKIHI